ncbi:hypothetical protein ACN6MT_20055 [Neobacillus niacini]|uniref:hypothetical protein n=1 Tax=Neobacillus niacini TaxID=86668 RepID=UPI003B02BFEE
MLVKDLYLDCLQNKISSVAHYIYHLLEQQKLSLDDDSSKIDLVEADLQKVEEMIKNDVLGIHKMCVYSLKMNQRDFVFIFAASEVSAIQYYRRTFGNSPLNCHEYPLDFQFYRGNDVISFRDMRQGIEEFPAIAGYFTR